MVELIKQTKDTVLERLDKAINENGTDRMNVQEVGMLADVVKDLAEAEESCWEAEYYRSVTEAMEGGSGYDGQMGMRDNQMGYDGMYGAQGGNSGGSNRGGSQGSYRGRSGYRDSRGRYARRGYGSGYHEHIDALKMELQNADQQEREQIMNELRGMGVM